METFRRKVPRKRKKYIGGESVVCLNMTIKSMVIYSGKGEFGKNLC